jgi:hypothetical protein
MEEKAQDFGDYGVLMLAVLKEQYKGKVYKRITRRELAT